MASAQVDAAHVEELAKPAEETTLGSPVIEGSAKAPAPQNIESPCDDDDEEPEDVILPDELGKEDDLDEEDQDQKGVAPQIIEDEDEDDEDDEQVEAPAAKSEGRAAQFPEEEGDGDD